MRLVLLVAAATLAAGCSSLSNNGSSGGYNVDQGKMAAVEQYAARLGVQVIWINPPRKSAPETGG